MKKFNRKRFRSLLQYVAELTLTEQKKALIASYNNWKGTQEQIDDICVVGVKI